MLRQKTPTPKIELLRGISLFRACSQKDLKRVAELVDEIHVPAGRTICREGVHGRECFVISSGTAAVTLAGEHLATLEPGEVFGEMSLLDSEPRSATVTADTDMWLLVLDARAFATLLDRTPGVSRKILKSMVGRLREVESSPSW